MDPLATENDLDARGVVVPDSLDATTLLASASSAVRDAAGCPISQETSTVTLTLDDPCTLTLPGRPVTAVASLAIDGTTISPSTLTDGRWSDGWRLWGDSLLLRNVRVYAPATATVTYTHGLLTVPDDIVDLVCSMVAITLGLGYGTTDRLQSFRLGDYSEAFTPTAGSDSPSPMSLPDSVRNQLRARFGNNVAVV